MTQTKKKAAVKKTATAKNPKPQLVETLVRLDLGCGRNKAPGFIGVDCIEFPEVDDLVDLTAPWPWANNSVDEVHCSHFFEHLTNPQRIHFWNELYRVLKVGAGARVITPHWSNSCAYGDPTHQWPPVSEWAVYYTNKVWRDVNAPHCPITADFDFVVGGSWDSWLETRNQETKMFAMQRYINSYRDLIFTLTKRG